MLEIMNYMDYKYLYSMLRGLLAKITNGVFGILVCLEVWRGRRVEGKGGRRGQGNDYPFPLFGCFKN